MRFAQLSAAMGAAALLLSGAGCLGGSSTASSVGGVWVSSDSGASWTEKHTLLSSEGVGNIGSVDVLSFATDPQDDSALYLGTQTSGLFTSLDTGSSWVRPEDASVRSGAILDLAVSANNVCTFYILKADQLIKSTTCGRAFTQVYLEGRTNEALTALALDWYSTNTVYMGTTEGEFMKSLDGGATWTTLFRAEDSITTIEVSNADSRYIMMGTQRSGLYRSEDGGVNWVSLEDSTEDMKGSDRVYGLAQSSDGGVVLASTKYGLLRSTDKGLTWEGLALLTPAGDVAITALAIDPNHSDVYAYGTATALYVSEDGGTTWATQELPSSRSASTLSIAKDGTFWLGVRSLED